LQKHPAGGHPHCRVFFLGIRENSNSLCPHYFDEYIPDVVDRRIPKLKAAGSNPVTRFDDSEIVGQIKSSFRSMFSIFL
jgi:hypothetical protein